MYLLTPYLLFRLWRKGRVLPAYKQRIPERFASGIEAHGPVDVWVHAVSLGEVIAVTPLIDEMLAKNWSVLITTMTPTGSERVKTRFGNKVLHTYVPYDISSVVKRFYKKMQPRVLVIMETELWPNLIHQAYVNKIPVFLANARLSERSLKGYMKFKFLFKPVLQEFSGILAQSEDDAKRFIALGADKKSVHVLGNIKFDLQLHLVDSKKFIELKNHWGSGRTVVIAASTHDNEESLILSQLRQLQEAIPNMVLLIAPRHPERFPVVHQLCAQSGFRTGLRSNLSTLSHDNEIVVLDCLGELLGLYQISDIAFVGGSLVPVGGHNVLEPIAMNIPVISGNQVHNFKTICRDLEAAEAFILVDHIEQLRDAVIKLHQDEQFKKRMVDNASRFLESNKGSLLRHLQVVEKQLKV